MQTKFTTSTNIIRDSEGNLNYIPTPNAIRVVNQIANDFQERHSVIQYYWFLWYW